MGVKTRFVFIKFSNFLSENVDRGVCRVSAGRFTETGELIELPPLLLRRVRLNAVFVFDFLTSLTGLVRPSLPHRVGPTFLLRNILKHIWAWGWEYLSTWAFN